VPSRWARERFGDAAQVLLQEIPVALKRAHESALRAHLGLGVTTNEAYGLIWVVQHLELVGRLRGRGIEGFRVIRPKGARYELAVIGETVLYPWRYADETRRSLEDARMELSEVRRNLLALAEEPVAAQLSFDEAHLDAGELDAAYEEDRQALLQLAAGVGLVTIAYASNPHAGILHIEWGEARQADEDGHLVWKYREPLPLTVTGEGGDTVDIGAADVGEAALGAAPEPVPETVPRFDDAPLREPALTSRPPLTGPGGDHHGEQPALFRTGSDDGND
jgi:hypothetical protein